MWKSLVTAGSLLVLSITGYAEEPRCLELAPAFWNNSDLPFVAFKGEGRFGAGIGMSVQYGPIRSLRERLQSQIGKELQFFRGWNPDGEAHVTVITPLEFFDILGARVSIEKIAKIARANKVQTSDLRVQGIGRGQVVIDGRLEETYFLIIESKNLRRIRRAIYREFVARGGSRSAWNPDRYFPHVTIGFTKRDLHEDDGVLKDANHSLDERFRIAPGRCR